MDRCKNNNEARVEDWKNLAILSARQLGNRDYCYPSTDQFVDDAILQQDVNKTDREIGLLREAIACDWTIAIDFGTGVGRNLPLFDLHSEFSRLVVAVEPDADRAEKAAQKATQLGSTSVNVVQGDIRILEEWPAGEVDLITSVQVLGHVERAELSPIVAGIHRLLCRGGRWILCVPVVGESFAGQDGAAHWTPPSDYFHFVDLKKSPFARNFRNPVSGEAYDALASSGGGSLLPVRSYYQPQMPPIAGAEFPFQVDQIPFSLAEALGSRFEVVRAMVYSIHRLTPENDAAAIGDLMLVLSKV